MALFTLPFKENRAEWLKDSRKKKERRGKSYLDSLLAKQLIFGKSSYINSHTYKKDFLIFFVALYYLQIPFIYNTSYYLILTASQYYIEFLLIIFEWWKRTTYSRSPKEKLWIWDPAVNPVTQRHCALTLPVASLMQFHRPGTYDSTIDEGTQQAVSKVPSQSGCNTF